MRLAKLGKPSPNKGNVYSKETRKKMSLDRKGRSSPRKGIKTGKSSWNRGIWKKKVSEEKK